MPTVELKEALSGVLFLFIDGGLEEMPTKIGVSYELSRGVVSSHGAKPHFELRRCARETAWGRVTTHSVSLHNMYYQNY